MKVDLAREAAWIVELREKAPSMGVTWGKTIPAGGIANLDLLLRRGVPLHVVLPNDPNVQRLQREGVAVYLVDWPGNFLPSRIIAIDLQNGRWTYSECVDWVEVDARVRSA